MVLDSKIKLAREHFGITELKDWGDVSPAWLLGLDGIGPKTLNHIRLYLAPHGVALKGDGTPEFWQQHLGSAQIVQQMSEEDVYVPSPFCVLVDNREQHPWTFQGMKTDSSAGKSPLFVVTKPATLESGDYSIEGYGRYVAIERKSKQDLYSTIGQGRERFQAELERLNRMEFAAVVVEAGWGSVLHDPPPHSKLTPKTVYRSVIAWQQRLPRVHWWFCDSRAFAERTSLRMLERFWRDVEQGKRELQL